MTSRRDEPLDYWAAGPHASAIANLNSAIIDLVDRGKSMPLVLIDGPAGAGKSTLASHLQNTLFRLGESAPRLIHMDDLYPGWDGLGAGSEYLMRNILGPLSQGRQASWQVYDWQAGARTDWREFSGGTPLIVEGCGSISAASAGLADFRIWVDAPEETRLGRWLAREGNDEHWTAWRAQELDFFAREQSRHLAELVFHT
jgi:uridine kinase